MKAILVGSVGADRVYYVTDAQRGEKDGIIIRGDGSSVKVNLISFAAKSRNIKKIRTTRFHRFLWDSPKMPTSGNWYDTFITKVRPLDKKILTDVKIVTDIGQNAKKIKKKDALVNDFILSKSSLPNVQTACCGEMVKSNQANYSFKSSELRREAWVAMQILRKMEN